MGSRLLFGDCVEQVALLPEASVDAVVCDPPYELGFMGKSWDKAGVSFDPDTWRVMLRVLKPGGHLLAFGGTRTYHRIVVAIEDAGFEIRDQIQWLYGSGFPKSMNVGKAIDKAGQRLAGDVLELSAHIRECREASGVSVKEMASWFPYVEVTKNWERQDSGVRVPSEGDYRVLMERIGCSDEWIDFVRAEDQRRAVGESIDRRDDGTVIGLGHTGVLREATTELAQQWQGWGTALKPAHEPIVLARKPLIGTVAKNVLEYGTGALNIDGTRVGYQSEADQSSAIPQGRATAKAGALAGGTQNDRDRVEFEAKNDQGRWPANVILGHHEECEELGTKKVKASGYFPASRSPAQTTGFGIGLPDPNPRPSGDGDGMETVTAWNCHPDCPVRILDSQSGVSKSSGGKGSSSALIDNDSIYGKFSGENKGTNAGGLGDKGGASRFFYQAKASKSEREAGLDDFQPASLGAKGNGLARTCDTCGASVIGGCECPDRTYSNPKRKNNHPTVKPIALMRYLVRLVTPPGGTVLDPFVGSGTTGIAAIREGFEFIGVEKEPDYYVLAVLRIHAAEEETNGKP